MADQTETDNEAANSAEELTPQARVILDAKRAKKKAKAGKRGMDNGSLNINSMMDIMTILLVFLLKQFGEDPLQIKMSEDLRISKSISLQTPTDMTTITVTRKGIYVKDNSVAVVKDTGSVDASVKEGGNADSLIIVPLLKALQDAADHQKEMARLTGSKFEGKLTIIGHRTTPYQLITEVLYTAGKAEFGEFKFAAIKTRES